MQNLSGCFGLCCGFTRIAESNGNLGDRVPGDDIKESDPSTFPLHRHSLFRDICNADAGPLVFTADAALNDVCDLADEVHFPAADPVFC